MIVNFVKLNFPSVRLPSYSDYLDWTSTCFRPLRHRLELVLALEQEQVSCFFYLYQIKVYTKCSWQVSGCNTLLCLLRNFHFSLLSFKSEKIICHGFCMIAFRYGFSTVVYLCVVVENRVTFITLAINNRPVPISTGLQLIFTLDVIKIETHFLWLSWF